MRINEIKDAVISNETVKLFKEIFFKHIICSISISLVLLYLISSFLWHYLDAFFTIGTLIVIVINQYQNKKKAENDNAIVPIFLKNIDDNSMYKIKVDIPRKDISRSEIQGLLGNFLIDSTKRYNIEYMSEIDYLKSIYKIKNYEISELVINITNEELTRENENKRVEMKKENPSYVGFNLNKMEKVEYELHQSNN